MRLGEQTPFSMPVTPNLKFLLHFPIAVQGFDHMVPPLLATKGFWKFCWLPGGYLVSFKTKETGKAAEWAECGGAGFREGYSENTLHPWSLPLSGEERSEWGENGLSPGQG